MKGKVTRALGQPNALSCSSMGLQANLGTGLWLVKSHTFTKIT